MFYAQRVKISDGGRETRRGRLHVTRTLPGFRERDPSAFLGDVYFFRRFA